MEKKKFKQAVAVAWEQISTDAGEPDGCNAVNHLEVVFYHMVEEYRGVDQEMYEKIRGFDPELVQWAKEELKTYG